MNSKLKELRISKGYTLKELSRLSGVSTTYLSCIENGIQTNPSLDIVDKIARGLKEDVVYIYYIIKNIKKASCLN